MDSIRIDPKLEAETANYWRFRHEYFQRGRPDLLLEIKRMNGAKGTAFEASADDKGVKSEVNSLKKRIEEMSKNIDQLTAMVNNVSLKQSEITPQEEVGEKRQKPDPEYSAPTPDFDTVRPDEMFSSMDLEQDSIVFPGVASLPVPDEAVSARPAPSTPTRETSTTSQVSDNDFVDDLFDAFAAGVIPEPSPVKVTVNQPDPELMKRLGDALMLLPHGTQVMIVDRLVAAITGTDTKKVPACEPQEKDVPPPLAAATLAALLHHYSLQVGDKSSKGVASKTIPVIPVHA